MSSMYGASSATPSIAKVPGTGYNQITLGADPRTIKLWEQLMGGISPGLQGGLGRTSQLASGGSEEMWNQLEAPALRQFGQLQGNIASRFSGMGSGARRSSGFQNALGGASTDLAERLQSQRISLQQQAIRDLMGMSQTLLGTPLSDTALIPREKPWWQEFLTGIGGAAGQAGGLFGGMGAAKLAGFI